MTREQFFLLLGDIDGDMILKAGEEKNDKRIPLNKVRTRICIAAACIIVCMCTLIVLPYIPERYDLLYEQTPTFEGNEGALVRGNAWIYYESEGGIKKEYVSMPLSIKNVFETWKHLSDLDEDIALIYVGDDEFDFDNGYRLEISYEDKTFIFVLSSAITSCENFEVKLDSLVKTMQGYFKKHGVEVNGSVIDSNHIHNYDRKNQSMEYCKIKESCVSDGEYYYSCICSQKGDATFTVPKTEHDYVNNICINCGQKMYSQLEYSLSSDKEYYIVTRGCSKTDTAVVIPPEYKGKPVKEIGNKAFYGYSNLKSVDMPDSITCIKSGAFYQCRSLSQISFPYGLTSIEDRAFLNCCELEEIEFPDSLVSLGKESFYQCYKLERVKMSKNILRIEDAAFSDCSKLVSIDLPESLTSIGEFAFRCTAVKEVKIPSQITSISNFMFEGSALETIELHDGITAIGGGAFSSCVNLTNIELPESIVYFGDGAFKSCTGLVSIKIPSGITEIQMDLFSCCSSLTNVEMHDNIISIGFNAFWGCSSLESINIPDKVISIGSCAFRYCKALKKIKIPAGVTLIDTQTFLGCSKLETVELPYGIITIGEYAFEDCVSLESIELPDSVTTIKVGAFRSCEGLESIVLSEKLEWIHGSVFNNCYLLRSITFRGEAPTFESDTFYNIIAVAYYDPLKTSWLSGTRRNYGGTITWVPIE